MPALAAGVVIPRGTLLRSNLGKGERTACTFQTAHAVRLLPIKLVEARYFTRDLVQLNLPAGVPAKAAIRLRLQVTAGVPFKEVQLDPLAVLFPRRRRVSVLDLRADFRAEIGAGAAGAGGRRPDARGAAGEEHSGGGICQPGSPAARDLAELRRLPDACANISPSRNGYRFFELGEMAEAVKSCKGNQLDLIIALKDVETRLEGRVDASYFELFCTPALNLFSKQLDRIDLSRQFSEFQVVADRNRPLDFEVFRDRIRDAATAPSRGRSRSSGRFIWPRTRTSRPAHFTRRTACRGC